MSPSEQLPLSQAYPLRQYNSLSEIQENDSDSSTNSESNYLKKLQDSGYSIKSISSDDEYDNFEPIDSNPFLDENLASYYKKVYDDCEYECRHVFDPSLSWSQWEEEAVIKKLDYRIAFFACMLFVGLEISRLNLQQALSDGILQDLNLSNNEYNTGCTIFLVTFLLGELPSSIICKKLGADKLIPLQMISLSIFGSLQCFLSGKKSFYTARFFLGIALSGLIPELILLLSTYYKANELPVRLSWFWTTSSLLKIALDVSAMIILKLRGFMGLEGWRYLFLIEGLISMTIGFSSIRLLIPNPTESKSKYCPQGWFNDREVSIIVNRLLRDDPSKGDMNHRQGISLREISQALFNFDLWPIYIIGLIAFIPVNTVGNYTNITLRNLGWSATSINFMAIPHNILHIIFLLQLTKLSERVGQRALVCLLSSIWLIPLISILHFWDNSLINPWRTWGLCTLIVGTPYIHAICVSWVSRNAGSIKTRTIASAVYNMAVQIGSAFASNIYRDDDAPNYNRGNRTLFIIALLLFPLLLLVKAYYEWKNWKRQTLWNKMSVDERNWYIKTTSDEGNKRLDFKLDS